MRTFVAMRQYISTNLIKQKYINEIVLKDNRRIDLLKKTFSKLEEKEKNNHLFFEGQIYDSYSLLVDLLNKAEKEIIIIDNYAGKELFDILKDINKKIKIVTKNLDEVAIKKYQQQYENLEIIINLKFHDRFIIIDKSILYHCGSSFKDLGKKCFAINKIEDREYLNKLLDLVINEIVL